MAGSGPPAAQDGAAAAAATAAPPPPARTGYAGFGSFFNEENVEDAIRDPSWAPPANPCEQSVAGLAANQLGAAARPHFSVDFRAWTFLNHGAFGAPLACAQREADAWRRRCEAQPLLFLDRQLFPQLMRVMRELAAFVGCRPRDLALVPNATTGLNAVIQGLRGRVGPGDALFSLDIGYGSVKRMLQVAAEQTGAQHVQHTVQLPLSRPEELVAQVAAALPANARFAVVDAVTSNTAIVLPLEQLVALFRSRGVEVLVDGAHALGMLPLDLSALGADYFVANCHKWLSAPRGSAFVHVQERHQGHVRPLVVSHGYGSGFVSDFIWSGNQDYAPLLAISAALRAWRSLGPDTVPGYQRRLLAEAVALLTDAWGTDTLVPLEMCASGMALVRLPPSCAAAARAVSGEPAPAEGGATSAHAKWVQDALHHVHRIECPVKCIAGRLYVRLSVHIYNVASDYERLAAAVGSIAGGQAAGGQAAGGAGAG